MNIEPMFVPEQLYNRKRDIRARFGGQEQGGMITPARYNLIFLVTGNSGRVHGYEDHWSEDGLTFFYFGEGQAGDMKFTKGTLALRDHVSRGEDVHLFEEVPEKSGYLRYKGQMVCTGFTLVDAPDTERNSRRAILFELVPLQAFQTTAEAAAPESSAAETEEEWSRASLDELRRKAVANSAEYRTPVERRALYRMRSRAVRLYVLRRANGVCEGCRNPAPFVTAASIPYLEPHHIRRLTDGGPDSPRWVADRYEVTVREFGEFLAADKITLLQDISRPLVERFKVWRVERINEKKHSRGATGLALDAAILHRMFSFAVENEMVVKNPVRMEGTPGENPQNGAEPFTAAQLSKMREQAGPDLLMFLLLRWTGLRGVDAVKLTWSEVHFDHKEIERVTQKRKKRVILPLHAELVFALEAEREKLGPQPSDRVLLNPATGTAMTRPRLYTRMLALGKRAGVPGAHPHRFRDTLAVDMLSRGASP